MYLIVGLGNPDKKYLNTFHNVGFLCVDALADKLNATFNKKECDAVTAHTNINGNKVIIAKPTTYMNLSGVAVSKLLAKYKIDLSNLIVIYDDIDLPLGNVRIRINGSAGTHNGMRSIVQYCTSNVTRVRVGIQKQTPMALIDYVLSQITTDDHITYSTTFSNVADALYRFGGGASIDTIMQQYNSKRG